jgi:catechol 2,3-dioxygenase-like lactoylglutathione lyase family enzyme
MTVLSLEHYNLTPTNLDTTVDFYTNIVGFEQGFRPDFSLPGVWLYAGKVPVIHVTVRDAALDAGSGHVHHVAFRVSDMDGHVERLEKAGIEYRGQKVPGMPMSQVFFEDPDGVTIELNHADEELAY